MEYALMMYYHLTWYTCCPHWDDVQWPWPRSIPHRSDETFKGQSTHALVRTITDVCIDGLPYNLVQMVSSLRRYAVKWFLFCVCDISTLFVIDLYFVLVISLYCLWFLFLCILSLFCKWYLFCMFNISILFVTLLFFVWYLFCV